jgi:hypothetical protein
LGFTFAGFGGEGAAFGSDGLGSGWAGSDFGSGGGVAAGVSGTGTSALIGRSALTAEKLHGVPGWPFR